MRRRIAFVAAGAVAALGLVVPMAQAQVEGPDCPEGTVIALRLNVDVNGQGADQSICLPPEAPAVP